MILANLGNATVGDNKLVTYTPQQEMDFRVTSSDEVKTNGVLGPNEYTEVIAKGNSPWTVEMGSKDFSRAATVKGIESQEVTLSCLLVWPMGPNEAHIFVNR